MSQFASADALGSGVLTVGRVGAGTGCKYLTAQVAAGKDDFAELSPAQALTYYSDTRAHGESPGRWLGRGRSTLGLDGSVSATELENLIGHARHPRFNDLLQAYAIRLLNDHSLTAPERQAALAKAEKNLYLGRAFATYESAADRAERVVADLGEDADAASKDAIRARVLAEGDRQTVAAYELTFTPVKSVSVLAAAGGERVWQEVMAAHRAAVDTALEYVQKHAAYSRAGVNGVRQIDTQGLVIAAFEHRMSRERDPNIHTHAIVANRVLCADGKWRTVDGRAVYAASVGARAIYEQALETELADRLGVRFSVDERRTIREVHGIPLAVIELFSKRRAAIEQAMGAAVDDTVTSAGGWRRLARRFTLSTRSDKTGAESTAEAIARWQHELAAAGYRADALVDAARVPVERRPRRPRSDAQILAEAVTILNQTRAVWTRHHAVLAISRVYPPEQGRSFQTHEQRVDQLVNKLLADSVQVSPPDVITVGPTLRRHSDAQSVYNAHADVLYAARSTVAAEQRILDALEDANAPLITPDELAPTAARHDLGDDQLGAVYDVLTTGTRISALVGAAGSGKTYVQRAIAAAWSGRTVNPQHPGAADVLALAPSQIAAHVLRDAIGARAENIAKWSHEYRKQVKKAAAAEARRAPFQPDPAWTLRPGQLVIVDEAGMVTTRDLDAILAAVRKAGAKLLLVGDDRQLGAIGAGGMFRTIVDRTHAPTLSTVRRFRDEPRPGEKRGPIREWECAASLALRARSLDALAEYERRGRIHAGPLARMQETSYRAWLTDHLAFEERDRGEVALLMADTEASAATLSARARADLVRRGHVHNDGTVLADGNRAGVGDLIVTRLNERRIRAEHGEGFVANRDTWRVTARRRDGSLTVTAVTGGARTLRLPATYVTTNVQLAYAGTVHSAQGRTVTTARGLVTESTSAEALYVMMSRGERSNNAYVVTDDPDREAHQRWPAQHHLSVLAAILDHDDQPATSVADAQRDLYDQATSVSRLRIIFGDLSTVIRGAAYETLIADHAGADAAARAVSDPAWATLVRALGTAQTLGWDSRQLLIEAVRQRELGSAADVAAVLHWRCENITGHWREAPGRADPTTASWADHAAAMVAAARADAVNDLHITDAAAALRQIGEAIDHRATALARQLAEQARHGQAGGYDAGESPSWLRALGPVPTSGRDLEARREAWLRNARAVAVYQDATGYQPTGDDPLGPRPPAGDAEARELWNDARAALAAAPMSATLRAMATERLQGWVAEALTAETADQPAYVGHELRSLSLRARAQRTRVNRLRHELTTADGQLTTATGRRWRRNQTAIASLQRIRDDASARLDRAQTTLDEIDRHLRTATRMHQAWQEWEQASHDTRVRGRLAAQELSLRGVEPTEVSPPASQPELASSMSAARHQEQYAIQAAAADWFRSHLRDRWAARYLDHRGLAAAGDAAQAGYSPSRPGHWTLLLDHLRGLGYSDEAITTSGLATWSRGGLIDRFRDRIVLPILDTENRPIGFIGRKPTGDSNPDNPKYLNPTTTPLYEKSRVLYGLDANAVAQLEAGARAIIVEGPMDRLALQLAATDVVPLATCGTALTETHLDLLAQHTPLDRVILGFDADTAGNKATLAAGRKLMGRGVSAAVIDVFTPPLGTDAAVILETAGPNGLANALANDNLHRTLLDLLVDEELDRYDSDYTESPLRDLPISGWAASEAVRLVGDTLRRSDGVTPDLLVAQSQRLMSRIADRCGVPAEQLWNELVGIITQDIDEDAEYYSMPGISVDEPVEDQRDTALASLLLSDPDIDEPTLEHDPNDL